MFRGFIFAATVGALAIACEAPLVDPFESDAHYSVYGFLDPAAEEQFVRVVPVRRFPEHIQSPTDPHAEIDARVESLDLNGNVTTRWIHRLQQLEDRSYGHVFSSSSGFRVGNTYRLTIRRSDGVETTAETTIPRPAEPHIAGVSGDPGVLSMTWPDVSTPQEIRMSYCAKSVGAFSCSPILVRYGREGRRVESGWNVQVQLGRDLQFVRQQLGFPDAVTLELTEVEVQIEALDEAWTVPTGDIKTTEFAQPGALSNVTNGFGFWGSVGRGSAPVRPPAQMIEPFGYVLPNS